MSHHEFEDLAALEALGVATDEELSLLRHHLRGCAECRKARAEIDESVAHLALLSEPVAPPAALRSAILDAVSPSGDALESPVESNPVSLQTFQRGPSRWWLAAAAVFFIALFGWSELRVREERERAAALEAGLRDTRAQVDRLARENESVTRKLDAIGAEGSVAIGLTGQAAAPNSSARVFLDPAEKRAVVIFRGLPENAPDKSYELWVIPEGADPIAAGVFDSTRTGEASISIENIPSGMKIKALAVTVEPRGGVAAPTGPTVLLGASGQSL